MKVLLNVAREIFKVGEWIDCEGIQLRELDDGSFDLIVTTDVARMREADERMDEILGRAKTTAPSSLQSPMEDS